MGLSVWHGCNKISTDQQRRMAVWHECNPDVSRLTNCMGVRLMTGSATSAIQTRQMRWVIVVWGKMGVWDRDNCGSAIQMGQIRLARILRAWAPSRSSSPVPQNRIGNVESPVSDDWHWLARCEYEYDTAKGACISPWALIGANRTSVRLATSWKLQFLKHPQWSKSHIVFANTSYTSCHRLMPNRFYLWFVVQALIPYSYCIAVRSMSLWVVTLENKFFLLAVDTGSWLAICFLLQRWCTGKMEANVNRSGSTPF